jgi:hypothetical protein
MKIIWPWQQKRVERELSSVESMLSSAFKPVTARPAFVQDLRKKLVGSRNPLAKAGLSTLELILLIGGAIVGVVVLILSILGRFGNLFGKLKFWGKKKDGVRINS